MSFARPSIAALLLTSLLGLNLLHAASGWSLLTHGAPALFVLYAVHCIATPRRREIPLLSIAGITGLSVLLWHSDPWPVLWAGAGAGTSLGALIMALGLLQAPAATSRLVRRCGEFLIAQGPGRRYLALTAGGHLFGIVLNLGALSLLGSMIQSSNTLAAAGGNPRVRDIRNRRMSLALLRGFGAVTLWAPSTITLAVCLSLAPSLEWAHYAPWGIGLAVMSMAAGWVMDRLAYSRHTRLAVTIPVSAHRMTETLLPMTLIVCAMLLAIVLVQGLSGWSLVRSLTLAVPLFSVLWLSLQFRRRGIKIAGSIVMRRLRHHLTHRLPHSRYEVLVLSLAGFIAAGVAALIPPQEITALAVGFGLPPYLLLVAMIVIIVIAGQIGINPVVTVSLLGSAANSLTPASLPPFALFLSLVGAWNLVAIGSPMSAMSMIVGRAAGQSPQTIVYRWNGRYLLLAFATLLTAVAVAMTV